MNVFKKPDETPNYIRKWFREQSPEKVISYKNPPYKLITFKGVGKFYLIPNDELALLFKLRFM